MSRILTIARITFREASRKRVLWMALAAGLLFLLFFATVLSLQKHNFEHRHIPPFAQHQALAGLLVVGAYAVDMLVVAMSVLTSVDTISGEISSGTIQAIAARPVSRVEILTGKWLGFSTMLVLYIGLMLGGIELIGIVVTGVSLRHFAAGFGLVCLEAQVLLCLTLFLGTWLSTLTNGVAVLSLHGLAFVGGWIEQAGALTQTPQAVAAGVMASLIMPSESLWRRAAIEMQSPIVTSLGASPFSAVLVPSPAMVAYACVYAFAFLTAAAFSLWRRDF